MLKPIALTLAAIASAAGVHADVSARFIEGAPKDRFVLTNTGTCALADVTIQIDLSTSAAGLIFDVTGSGAGVEVYQPFELVQGAELLRLAPQVTDGANSVSLDVQAFPAGAQIVFTIDVDDTLAQSDLGQIRVAGSEIAGAALRVDGHGGRFDRGASAVAATTGCSA